VTAQGAEIGAKIERHSEAADKAVRDIRRATRRQFAAEKKVRIVIAGLRGEDSMAELCRKEGINQNLYCRWSKDFLEAGKKRLAGDTTREATNDEVKGLRAETHQLKELVAELLVENRVLKKRCPGRPIHEVRGGREAGDHPANRAVLLFGTAHPGPARDPAVHLLSLVRALSGRAAPGPWKMASRRRAGSGTNSPLRSLKRCLNSRSGSRSRRPGS
jgi:transposase